MGSLFQYFKDSRIVPNSYEEYEKKIKLLLGECYTAIINLNILAHMRSIIIN